MLIDTTSKTSMQQTSTKNTGHKGCLKFGALSDVMNAKININIYTHNTLSASDIIFCLCVSDLRVKSWL